MNIRFIQVLCIVLLSVANSPLVQAKGEERRCPFAFPKTGSVHTADPLKFYLATNLTFPQDRGLITVALSAAKIADLETWETFEDLSREQVIKAWTAMVRAHGAHDVRVAPNDSDVKWLIQSFSQNATAGISMGRELLDFVGRHGGGAIAKRMPLYAEAILANFKTPEILELGKKMRAFAPRPERARDYHIAVSEIRFRLLSNLHARFPELAVPFYQWNPNYGIISKTHTVGKLLIDAFAYELDRDTIAM